VPIYILTNTLNTQIKILIKKEMNLVYLGSSSYNLNVRRTDNTDNMLQEDATLVHRLHQRYIPIYCIKGNVWISLLIDLIYKYKHLWDYLEELIK
jgi:collagenase-like PrtC family protease